MSTPRPDFSPKSWKIRYLGNEALKAMSMSQIHDHARYLQDTMKEVLAYSATVMNQAKYFYNENQKLTRRVKDLEKIVFHRNKSETMHNLAKTPDNGEQENGDAGNDEPDNNGTALVTVDTSAGVSPAISGQSVPGSQTAAQQDIPEEVREILDKLGPLSSIKPEQGILLAQCIQEYLGSRKTGSEKKRPVRKNGCQDWLDDGVIPTRRVTLELSPKELNQVFPDGYIPLGFEETEEIYYQPGGFYRIIYEQRKYTGIVDHQSVFRIAHAPEKLLSHSHLTIETLAFILTQKYYNGIPVSRLLTSHEFWDMGITKQRVYDWIHRASQWMAPLVYRVFQLAIASGLVQLDETYGSYCADGKVRTGYYWLVRTGEFEKEHPMAAIIFAPSRAEYVLEAMFHWMDDWKISHMTDGYVVYRTFKELHPENIGEHGECWFHARKKIVEAYENIPEETRNGSEALLMSLPE